MYLSFFHFPSVYSVINRDSKVHNFASSFFFIVDCYKGSGSSADICDPSLYKSPIGSLYESFSGQMLGCAYTNLFVWSNLNFYAHLPVNQPCPTQSVSSLILPLR